MRIVTVAALALACSGAFAQASAPDAVLLLVTSPGNELVTTLADGTGRTTLGTGAVQATWSPDGSRVAYVAAGSLRVVGADGSDPHVAFPVEPADRLFSSSW